MNNTYQPRGPRNPNGETSLSFHKISNADIPVLSDFFLRYNSRSCDFSIGGILMWTDYFDYEMCITRDTLFLKGTDRYPNNTLFYYPLGVLPLYEALCMIRDYCEVCGIIPRIIVPVTADVDDDSPAFEVADAMPQWMEYVYEIERFTTFAGKKMEKKRNHLNYFMHNYDYSTELISEDNISELIDFTRNFESKHASEQLAVYENEQTLLTLSAYSDNPYIGLIIRIDGHVAGYTFGEVVGDTCFVHVEKGNIEYRGIYQALSSEFSRLVSMTHPDVRYLNREEDMGDESLRQSKLSYHPCMLVCKYVFSLADLMALAIEDIPRRA